MASPFREWVRQVLLDENGDSTTSSLSTDRNNYAFKPPSNALPNGVMAVAGGALQAG